MNSSSQDNRRIVVISPTIFIWNRNYGHSLPLQQKVRPLEKDSKRVNMADVAFTDTGGARDETSLDIDSYEGEKILSDLKWVLYSESIAAWSYDPDNHYGSNPACDIEQWFFAKAKCKENQEWLNQIDVSHLQHWLVERKERNRMVLGYYFGYLIEYFLRFSPAARITNLVTGVHIQDQKSRRMVGSLKFMFSLPENPALVYHLECSIKFFCMVPDKPLLSLDNFVGPNLAESMYSRWLHTFRKLSAIELANNWIEKEFHNSSGDVNAKSLCLLKGYLFYPLTLWKKNYVYSGTPATINYSAKRMWWTQDIDEALGLGDDGCCWAVLPKLHWAAPCVAYKINDVVTIPALQYLRIDAVTLMNKDQLRKRLLEHFDSYASRLTPLLVAVFEPDESGLVYAEKSRGFVLKDDWNYLSLQDKGKPEVYKNSIAKSAKLVAQKGVHNGKSGDIVCNLKHDSQEKRMVRRCEICISFPLGASFSSNSDISSVARLMIESLFDTGKGTDDETGLRLRSRKHISHVRNMFTTWLDSLFGDGLVKNVETLPESQRMDVVTPVSHFTICAHIVECWCTVEKNCVINITEMRFLCKLITKIISARARKSKDAWCKRSKTAFVNLVEGYLQDDIHSADSTLEILFETMMDLKYPYPCEMIRNIISPSVNAEQIIKRLLFHTEKPRDFERSMVILKLSGYRLSREETYELAHRSLTQSQYNYCEEVIRFHDNQDFVREFVRDLYFLKKFKVAERMKRNLGVFPFIPLESRNQLKQTEFCSWHLWKGTNGATENTCSIWWIGSLSDLKKAAAEVVTILDEKASCFIGVDAEFGPDAFHRGSLECSTESRNYLSLIQIAFDENTVFLVDILTLAQYKSILLNFLMLIFCHPEVVVVTYGGEEDFKRLTSMLQEHIIVERFLDVQIVMAAHAPDYVDGNPYSLGLAYWVDFCFSENLDKSHQCSNWDDRPLEQEQIKYATLDAIAPFRIAEFLEEQIDVGKWTRRKEFSPV